MKKPPTETGCHVKFNTEKSMDKIVCVGERTWMRLLARLEELSTLAGEVRQKFDPQVSEG